MKRILISLTAIAFTTPAFADTYWFYCSASVPGRSFSSQIFTEYPSDSYERARAEVAYGGFFASYLRDRYDARLATPVCVAHGDRFDAQRMRAQFSDTANSLGSQHIDTGWAP